jgi:hypothetical protein
VIDDGPAAQPSSAAEVRRINAALDGELRRLAGRLAMDRLHEEERVEPGQEAWSAAVVLGHLGEFPGFFAGELRRWHADRTAPVGRTHESPERLAAVEASRGRSFAELVTAMERGFAELAAALEPLTDDDLHAVTHNRKYAEEPLTAFLDRYVLGHKRGHLRQLAAMPAAAGRA